MQSGTDPTIETTTIRSLIDLKAEQLPTKTFLISPESKNQLTFKELQREIHHLVHRLQDMGLSKGDKVAFMLDNSIFTVVLFLGAMYGGFVPVPLNVEAGQAQLEYILHHCDTRAVFTSNEYASSLRKINDNSNLKIQIIQMSTAIKTGVDKSHIPDIPLPQLQAEDDAILVYTSGSTGRPKGVLVSHRNVIAGSMNTITAHKLTSNDRSLCVLPLYHMNAQIITLLPTLLSAGSVVLPYRFNVNSFWDWVIEYHCTWFALVPTIISQLLHWADPYAENREVDLDHVRFARTSSAPLAPHQHRAFEEKFELLLIEAMGSTEAGSVIFSNPLPPAERKIGSPGIPFGFETRIIDSAGHELPQGQKGEITIRGPSVMKGYYKAPSETAEAIHPDGWLHTGDLGYMDEDGYVFIVGRAKELIIKGGENIAPREIDEAMEHHPLVMEAVAVGIPDPILGQDIIAYAVLKPGTSCGKQELLEFCEQRLGPFKTPSRITFVEKLPKGPSGKVQRLKLIDHEGDSISSKMSLTEEVKSDRRQRKTGIQQPFMPPRTPVEKIIMDIWQELLRTDNLSIHDNFFELGGFSLLASRILTRLRKRFFIDLTLHFFFEYPTVAQQAVIIDNEMLKNIADEKIIHYLTDLEQISDEETPSLLSD